MATYPKKLKTVEIHQMLDSQSVTVSDQAGDMWASMVVSQFEQGRDLEWVTTEQGNKTTECVPYHAVQYLVVSEEGAEYTKADPYYCEESDASEDDDEENTGGGK